MTAVICDAGPLVALLDRREQWHSWVTAQFSRLHEPVHTCEAALAEVAFLTRGRGLSPHHFMQLLHRGLVKVDFDFDGEWRSVGKLLEVYSNLPMSLADACLVRMSELHARSVVFTLDRDFLIYRKNRRLKIPLLAPFA
jgi:predicted nucleic acid-binding protein